MLRTVRKLVGTDGEPTGAVAPPTLLDRVPDALLSFDRAWQFAYLNAAAEQLLKRSRTEVLGQTLWQVFPEMVGSIFEERYRRAVAEGIPVAFEACHPPDGIWIEVRAFPTPGGLEIHARDIAPGKRAAEALRHWVQVDDVRFRALIEHAADIVAQLNLDGTVRYVSPAVERVLGYSPEEWIGRSLFDAIYPDDCPRMRRLFAEQINGRGITATAECRFLHLDGSWRHIEMIGNNLLDDPSVGGLVVTARDITERKRMQEDLHASEASFEAIFDGAAIGIGVADMSSHIFASNRALQVLVGLGEEDLRGKTLGDLTAPDDHCADRFLFAELVSAQRDQVQEMKRFRREDGQIRWGSLTLSLVRSSEGSPRFAIFMVEDVTEQHLAAVELAEARRLLAESQEAERLRLARDLHDGPVQDLLAISYHLAEHRRSLGGDRSGSDLGPSLDAARRDALAVVRQLRDVIGELRPPGLAEFGLPAALDGYVARLRREAGDRDMPTIELKVDPQLADLPQPLALPLFLAAQEAIRNALRHSHARRVTVDLRRRTEEVVARIGDDGCGFLVPERLNELAQAGHFGLVGLAERVHQANGVLTVASALEFGTTVTVRLPLTAARSEHDGTDPDRAGR